MKNAALLAALIAATPALAQDFSYTYLEASRWDTTEKSDIGLKNDEIKSHGYTLTGSYHFDAGLLVQLHYNDGKVDKAWGDKPSALGVSADLDGWGLFVGGAGQARKDVSLWGGLGYERDTVEISIAGYGSESSDFDTYSAGGGVRYWLVSMLEVNAALRFKHFRDDMGYSDNDVQVSLGARLQPAELVSIGVNFDYLLDYRSEALSADVRLQF
ncbi:MAG: outer membrane beta-barrel protein [Spongiibacteraceae bacterium]|nr:outer membrane beta-barrel protein [Spongiibacteraceae bacterium]